MIYAYIAGGVVLVLALLVSVLYAVGRGLPADHVVTATLHLQKSEEQTYALLHDIASWSKWDTGITKMVVLEPAHGRPRVRMHMGRNSFVLTLAKEHAPSMLSLEAVDDHKFFEGRWDYHLSREGQGVKVKLTEYGKVLPPIPRVMMRLGVDPAMYLKRHLTQVARHFGEDPKITDAAKVG
ncbi:MAG: SRPBCC family protein [Phycisphaerales bacterium]